MTRKCWVHNLGIVPYQVAWDLQETLAGEISVGDRPPTLLLLEHPHTYTFGRSGNTENLLWDEPKLKEKGIDVHWVDRGGDVTYHGPGQLVGYPLLPLGTPTFPVEYKGDSTHIPRADYVHYLRNLEAALIAALEHLGVPSGQLTGRTGVWIHPPTKTESRDEAYMASVLPSKIASIGVKVDARGVTKHGFALNINPDMSYWEGIIGCGLEDYQEISLSELLPPTPDFETVIHSVITAFGEQFNFTMEKKPLQAESSKFDRANN